jgi:protein-S-isoprenylcysteine O-methyltransferase Ste14
MSLWGCAQLAGVIYVLTHWLDFADYHLPIWAGWVGTAVFAAALWLLWRSHVDLGRNWSPTLEINEDHALVTRGVYRRVRHPMYTAHLLWGIAQALLLHNWIAGVPALAVFVLLYMLRFPREEQLMLDHFGEKYRVYMNRTGRLVPRLWNRSNVI